MHGERKFEVNLLPRYGERLVPLQVDELTIPLPDATADLLFWANLYHELDDPAASLAEGLRLLKAGGKIMIVDWKADSTAQGPPANHRVPADEVRADLDRAGFVDVTLHAVLEQHHVLLARKAAD